MEERHYLISDAAKMVAVEAHVLRYWEEELDLPIARTELGHRYYTRENIDVFKSVKRLKEEGLQLKAIRVLLQETAKLEGDQKEWKLQYDRIQTKEVEGISGKKEQDVLPEEEEIKSAVEETEQRQDDPGSSAELVAMQTNAQRLQLFKELVEDVVEKVVKENNDELQKRIEESIAKETDYLLHMQEQREEERFRKLDEANRTHQKNSRYVAAAKEKGRFFRWFGK